MLLLVLPLVCFYTLTSAQNFSLSSKTAATIFYDPAGPKLDSIAAAL